MEMTKEHEAAYLELYRRHRHLIRRTIAKRLRTHPHEVDDVLQEVYLKGRKTFDPERQKEFPRWMQIIARRHVVDYLTGQRQLCHKDGKLQVRRFVNASRILNGSDGLPSPLETARATELSAAVEAVLTTMPERRAAVFRMRAYHGAAFKDIGAAFMRSSAWAMKTHGDVRRRLAAKLQGRFGPNAPTR